MFSTKSVPRPLLLLLLSIGCGRSPSSPTPTPGVRPTGTAPTVVIAITIDSTGSREAISGVSDVTVDASASSGSGLRYRIEFGDGTAATERTARHIYPAAGTYKATVTVTDDAGRSAVASTDVVVSSLLGRWVHAAYFTRANRVGVWLLTITSQEGATVRGMLTEDNADRGTVTGSISADRRVRLVFDRSSETFEGTIPSAFGADGSTLGLTIRGDSSNGEAFSFKRAAGEPTGPPPDAVLKMRFFSFGALFAITQISPVLFDGSTSRGDGLTWFIEFGDGQVSTTASATHPIEHAGSYTARLIVVDRFGRSDVESTTYKARSLVTESVDSWDASGTPAVCDCRYSIVFTAQSQTHVTGYLRILEGNVQRSMPLTGSIESTGDVRLSLVDSAVTLMGTLTIPGPSDYFYSASLNLQIRGGRHDGVTLPMHYAARY
jgi:hypothetical protein